MSDESQPAARSQARTQEWLERQKEHDAIAEEMLAGYRISPEGDMITCLRCGKTSHNRNDVEQRYCAFCHVFHEDRDAGLRGLA